MSDEDSTEATHQDMNGDENMSEDEGDDCLNDSFYDDDSITSQELQVRENSTMTAVFSLWKEGTLVDFTIIIEERKFEVHKVILASMSDYFKVMLTGSMMESQNNTVDLTEGVSIDAMEILLEFMYTNKIKITRNNVTDILKAAMYLQVQKVIDKCVRAIVQYNLGLGNCFEILSEFKGYALTDGIKSAQDFIRSNMVKITNIYIIKQMSCERIAMLAEVWEESEMKLFEFLVRWIDVDPEMRNKHWTELMTLVRFGLLSPSEIQKIKTFVSENREREHFLGSWCDLVEKAAEYHELPMHKKVLDTTVQTQVRAEPTLHAFSRDVTTSPGFYVHSDSNNWMLDKQLTPPEDGAVAYSVIVVNNFLVVFTDQSKVFKWLIFDPRTMKWSEMAQMPTEREGFAIAHHGAHLYTIGGSILHPYTEFAVSGLAPERKEGILTDIVERYDFSSNTWSACSKLPLVLRESAACFFGNTLYNSGGRQSMEDPDEIEDIEEEYPGVSRVDSFNLSKQRWESKAPMLHTRGRHLMSVMKLHGEKVICVVDRVLKIEHYSPSTNQWTRCTEFNFTQKFPARFPRNIWLGRGNSIYMLDVNLEKRFNHIYHPYSPDGAVMLTFPEDCISLRAPVEFFAGFPFRKEKTMLSLSFPEDPFPICALLAKQRDPLRLSPDELPDSISVTETDDEFPDGAADPEPEDDGPEYYEPGDSEPEDNQPDGAAIVEAALQALLAGLGQN